MAELLPLKVTHPPYVITERLSSSVSLPSHKHDEHVKSFNAVLVFHDYVNETVQSDSLVHENVNQFESCNLIGQLPDNL